MTFDDLFCAEHSAVARALGAVESELAAESPPEYTVIATASVAVTILQTRALLLLAATLNDMRKNGAGG